ncbi:hypothetical protein HB777_22465 [Mesorhizobium loti]|nr:hypothetical protein HB777_22465 [Mesorhizobium loti]
MLGESLDRDMIAVRITTDLRTAVVASPDYFARFSPPQTPRDLLEHQCIGYRQIASGELYRWEFEQEGRVFSVAVNGPVVLDDPDLMLAAALDGVGIAYTNEHDIREAAASGLLVRTLQPWCPTYQGFFLYYSGRRQPPAALVAFIEMMRLDTRTSAMLSQ